MHICGVIGGNVKFLIIAPPCIHFRNVRPLRFDVVVILVYILGGPPKKTNTNYPKISNTNFIIHPFIVVPS